MSISAFLESRAERAWTAAIAAIFLVAIALYFPFTVDDAYIVARYAFNLAHHGVFAYDVDSPLSALTSPLQGLIEGFLYAALGIDPVVGWKVLSIIAAVLGVGLLAKLIPASRARLVFLILTLLSPNLVIWSVGGLETTFLLALLAAATYLYWNLHAGDTSASLLLALCAGLALITRFDSVLFLLPLAVGAISLNRGRPVQVAVLLLVPATVLLAWLVFSQLYFGHLLPSAVFAKTPRPSARHLITLLRGFFWTGVFMLAVLVWLRRGARANTDPDPRLAALRWALLLTLFYLLTMASTHMMFAFRAALPYLPILLFLLLVGAPTLPTLALPAFFLFMIVQLPASYLLGLDFPYSERLERTLLPFKHERAFWQEYPYVTVPTYRAFIHTLREQSQRIHDDWYTQSPHPDRPPIVFAYAEGMPGWAHPEIRYQGFLVSNTRCEQPDYVMDIRSPKLGISFLKHQQAGGFIGKPFVQRELALQLIAEDPHSTLSVSRYRDLDESDRAVTLARVNRCRSRNLW